MTDTNDFLGTTGEQKVAAAMEHIDTFIFDVLENDELSFADAPVEPELDLTKPATSEALPQVVLTITVKGGEQKILLTEENIATAVSKSALRRTIVAIVTAKPKTDAEKPALLRYLNLAVARLNELSE